MKRNYLNELPGVEETLTGYLCNRCGNRKSHLFGRIPRERKQAVYCRKCIEMGRVSTFEPLYKWRGPRLETPFVVDPCKWQGKLTPFQQRAADQINSAMACRAPLLVWAVCGAGKTEMLFKGLTAAFERGDRVCIASPRADVVRELAPRFKQVFPEVSISALYGGSEDKGKESQFTISTTHQLLRYEQAFDVMIIDEVDAFPYYTDRSLSFAANRARKTTSSLIYLTATPRKWLIWRAKLNLIPTVFVPARYHGHPLPVPQFVSSYRLKKSLAKNQLPQIIISWIDEKVTQNRRFLLFVPSIEMGRKIANLTNIECVDASDEDRVEKVEKYRNNKMNALITTTILERGVTFPSIDVAVIDVGHQVFDEAALVQIAGRAGRNAADPYGDVVFFHQGKTEQMIRARRSIEMMNSLARRDQDALSLVP
ncbi:DNA/RNA helicase [Salinibacillus xinjiangensis]|uniref:DNA/RNA helicase n=2 Tax=Salinibacillus xinjiangensis TaxID=1229268 RepID=A0A6G1X1C3_9BACI|nr:DNA/RNA helicase [Salinibacillus xinjiangensis]